MLGVHVQVIHQGGGDQLPAHHLTLRPRKIDTTLGRDLRGPGPVTTAAAGRPGQGRLAGGAGDEVDLGQARVAHGSTKNGPGATTGSPPTTTASGRTVLRVRIPRNFNPHGVRGPYRPLCTRLPPAEMSDVGVAGCVRARGAGGEGCTRIPDPLRPDRAARSVASLSHRTMNERGMNDVTTNAPGPYGPLGPIRIMGEWWSSRTT